MRTEDRLELINYLEAPHFKSLGLESYSDSLEENYKLIMENDSLNINERISAAHKLEAQSDQYQEEIHRFAIATQDPEAAHIVRGSHQIGY